MIFQLPGLVVNVRKPEIADVARMAQWLSSDSYVDNFGGIRCSGPEFYEAQAERMLQDNADDLSSNKYFLAEDRFTGHPVALAMLCKIDWKNRHAEYAYIIGESNYRAKLIAGDINVILYNYFFNGLNLNKVYGYVVASNTLSHRMNSFGGSQDGTLRMHRFKGSVATDVHVFSITKTGFTGFVNKHVNTFLKKHVTRGLIKWPTA